MGSTTLIYFDDQVADLLTGKKQALTPELCAKGKKEPWVLLSSLPESNKIAEKMVKIYASRMQIEECFRDLKSTKYGFGFGHINTNHIYRLNVFFLIAMLATVLACVIGWLAEKVDL